MDFDRQHGVRAQDVESVVCDVPPIVVASLRHEMPRTPSEARFSMQFAIGMTLLDPDWGLPALAPEQVTRADLRDLMRRVRMQTGPSWDDPARQEQAPEGAVVQVRMRDGTTLEGRRDKAPGSAAHPLSAAQPERREPAGRAQRSHLHHRQERFGKEYAPALYQRPGAL